LFVFQKRWEGLLRRALCRASGQEPATRGKKWKSKSAKTSANSVDSVIDENVDMSAGLIDPEAESNERHFDSRSVDHNVDRKIDQNLDYNVDRMVDQNIDRNVDRNFDRKADQNVDEKIDRNIDRRVDRNVDQGAGNLRFVTQFVDVSTDLDRLLSQNFSESTFSTEAGHTLGIIGLHTCGDLAAASLRIFLAKEAAR
jgi:hypothetical protein